MRVISKRKIVEFITKHPNSENPLLDWYRIVKHRNFENFAELKTFFSEAD